MQEHIFTGFGFGPIQAGLFAKEAFQSGNFAKIVIAEIDQQLVEAVRNNNGSYYVNIARKNGIETVRIDNIEIYNPQVDSDRQTLAKVLAESTEIVTSLPSVSFYDMGHNSVVSLIARALKSSSASATIVYTAENNNHAAEILKGKVSAKFGDISSAMVQFLNTVIGKMSQVVTELEEIRNKNIAPITPGMSRAFLVEEFNEILVSRCNIPDFRLGIEVFIDKEDLLPFEEAKLYGHNAVHSLLGYLGSLKGYAKMSELKDDTELMQIAREAFINESGGALIRKYSHLADEFFTEDRYRKYAEDLLERITSPYLDDTVQRAVRDPMRKLCLNDRLFGTMALALEQGIEPINLALGAAAAIVFILKNAAEYELSQVESVQKLQDKHIEEILLEIWSEDISNKSGELIRYTQKAYEHLKERNFLDFGRD